MRKRVLAVVLAIFLLLGAVANSPYLASAEERYAGYHTYPNNAKMKNGVGSWGSWRRSYWIDQSAMQYENYIVQARNDWVYTSNIVSTSIDIQRTYTKKDAVFEVFKEQRYDHSFGYYGETDHMEFSSSQDAMDGGGNPSRDYYWARIVLNGTNFDGLSTNVGGVNKKKGTIAHEFGHAFGLAHYEFRYNIMQLTGKERMVDCAQKEDLEGINHLYGGR